MFKDITNPKESAFWLTENGKENAAYWAGRYHQVLEKLHDIERKIEQYEAEIKSLRNALRITP